MQGGPEGARAALDAYWKRVAETARFSPIQRSPLDRLMKTHASGNQHAARRPSPTSMSAGLSSRQRGFMYAHRGA